MEEEKIVVDSSISLELISRVIKLISEVPAFQEKNARVERIEVLPGGLTNYNFKVTVGGQDYALRIAGDGTLEYLDRNAEKHNAKLMADLDINAEVIYYDENTGNQVCKYIDGKTLHIADFHDPDNLRTAAKLFKKYHTCGQKFLTDFDPIKVTNEYVDLLIQKNAEVFEGFEEVKEKVEEIQKLFEDNPQPFVPCHNDPLPENFILDETGMYLIDWEYAGNNDPMFDLGDFSIEQNLNREEEILFLKEYFDGHVTMKQYGLMVMHKFLCDALWSIWALLQIATGKSRDDYWPYGLNRFNRCVALMKDKNFDKYIQAIRENNCEEIAS